jgi:hypothetical protein
VGDRYFDIHEIVEDWTSAGSRSECGSGTARCAR